MSDCGTNPSTSTKNWRAGAYHEFSYTGHARRVAEHARLHNYQLAASVMLCGWITAVVVMFSKIKLGFSEMIVPMLAVLSFGILVYLAQRVAGTGNVKYLMALILIAAQYAYFCVPYLDPTGTLSAQFMGVKYNPDRSLFILGYSIVFMLLFVFGFFASPFHPRSLLTDGEWHRLNAFVFANRSAPILLIMGGSMLLFNFRLDEYIPSTFAFAGHLLAVAFPLCVIALSAGSTSKATQIFVFGVLYPLYYLIRIADGCVAEWVLANLVIFIGYVLLGKRPPLVLAVVAALLTVPLLRAKETYRNDFLATNRVYSMPRLESGLDYLRSGLKPNLTSPDAAGVTSTTARLMAGPIAFSRVLDYDESGSVAYQWGATFADLPLSVIPRALAPWKPEKNYGNWFGHTYGMLMPSDDKTSVNLPPIVESYVNFGNLGVFLAVLLGGICALLYDLFGGGKSAVSIFLLIAIFSSLTNTELSISLSYGQVLQMSAVAWVLLKLRRQYSGMRARRVLAK